MHIFADTDEQISILKQRGILFRDESWCGKFLLDNNYYNVVYVYKKYLLNDVGDECKEGVYFEDLIKLYKYDAMLRISFLKYILKIENELRSHLAYEFSKTYGPFAYLDKSVYRNDTGKDKEKAQNFIASLEELINKKSNNDEAIKSFASFKDGDKKHVPLWVLVNVFDYGTLRTFYRNINTNLLTRIAKNYYKISSKTLISMISSLNMIRNICAHNNSVIKFRIYKIDYQISDTPIHKKLNIEKDNRGKYLRGKTRFVFQSSFVSNTCLMMNLFKDSIHHSKRLRKLLMMPY